MRYTTLPILLAASLVVAAPAHAQDDFGKTVTGIAQSLLKQELDRRAYAQAQSLNSVSGYRNYLVQYPTGIYRANAEQALAKLGAPVYPNLPAVQPPRPPFGGTQSAAVVEASIGLTRTQRILIQKQMTKIGYPTGVADGLWGANTRTAIARWQSANKLSATGYLTTQQVRLIAQQAGPTVGPDPTGPPASDDPVVERLLGLTYAERREVQSRLTTLGYSTNGTDGVFGAGTRRALASWQRDTGLRATGYLTGDQLRALRRDTGG